MLPTDAREGGDLIEIRRTGGCAIPTAEVGDEVVAEGDFSFALNVD